MKNTNSITKYFVLVALAWILGCSDDFVDLTPQGSLNIDVLNNREGLDALLLSGYAALDGHTAGVTVLGWQNDHNNWLYGEIRADNALKGSSIGDQPDMNLVEQGRISPSSGFVQALWGSIYEGVARANGVLQVLANTEGLTDGERNRIQGEALFLRAHFFHFGRRYFDKIPYFDETVTDFNIPNDRDIFADIEADYLRAIDLLPDNPSEVGRAHRFAAQASLAKLYMDEGNFDKAKPLLDAVINSGRYRLFANYNDNFLGTNEAAVTDTEFIFQIQAIGREGILQGTLVNGIAQLHGCCGFLQPSQNLVNAHKTDVNGLPLLDTYNDVDLASDQGIASSEPFTPPSDNLDPRLDYTVARRGIPFLDFDINILPLGPGDDSRLFPGQEYVVDQVTYGPYRAKKFLPTKADVEAGNTFLGSSNINYSIHRLADILLLRAEVAVEENDLSTALDLVNRVRARARDGQRITFADGSEAANYVIETYPSFPNQDFARKAVRHERRLELALEGHRWFDLMRWGVAEETMTDYFATEDRPLLTANGRFVSNFLPIPESEIDLTRDENGNPTLKQNAGY